MLSPRLTNCVECSTIPNLINVIDCKMAELAVNLYNNTVFMLNQPVNGSVIIDLLNYRRILTFKYCNPDYAGTCITMPEIASRVRVLTRGCTPTVGDSNICSTTTTTSSTSTSTSSTTTSTTTLIN